MSYINFKVFENRGLEAEDVIFLIAIKQREVEYLAEYLDSSTYEHFTDLKLVEHVRAKRKDESSFETIRLSKEGKKLLEELETPEVEEEDKKVFEFLKAHYLKLGKEIGNGKKTIRHIRDFRIKSGIEKNNLIRLCLAFLQDEDNMTYNNRLEYAFFKSPTAFETRFDLEESRLYKYYIKREVYFKSIFEEY